MTRKLHYLSLVGAIALGAILRFWNLDLKPLWMDEVITALFSLGRNYNDLPLDIVFPLENLQQVFTLKVGVSCAQIAHTLATQSTHPPLFFCLMHGWLNWISSSSLSWWMRSLPALFGVGAVAAIYAVNTTAFSRTAGLMAASVMAVSPFAVYLSQEARHYTLPMLLISLALFGLIQIQRDFHEDRVRFWVWLGWAIANIIGLYVHYFFILAFIAQLVTLIWLYWRRMSTRHWLALTISTTIIVLSFIPWLRIMLSHFSRNETDWLPQPNYIAPLYQIVIGWVLMAIALPVENQPLWIAIASVIFMILFGILLVWQVFKGLLQLCRTPATQTATLTLLSFTVCVLLQFFAIAYLLGKDITAVPRYNFVYYPSICALIAASLVVRQKTQVINIQVFLPKMILLVGVICCIFVSSNLVFQKPFHPQQVAQNIAFEPSVDLMVVVGYRDYQDVALGLSFALELEKLQPDSGWKFAFFKQSPDFESVWRKLSELSLSTSKLNLWVIAPGIKRRDYPQQVALSSPASCTIDMAQHYRIGVPYQLYRCN